MACDVITGSSFSVGIGPEDCNTPGVQSTNFTYPELTEFDDGATKEYIEKRPAIARRDNLTEQIEVARYSDGTFGGAMKHESFGLVLRGIMGNISTDAVTIAPDFRHCAEPSLENCLCTSSIAFVSPAASRVVNNAVIKELNITGESGGDVTYTASFEGKFPVDSPQTTATTTELSFQPKDFQLYLADTIALIDSGIAGGSLDPICIQSIDLTLTNETVRRACLGDTDPSKIISTLFSVTGSFEVDYTVTTDQYIQDWVAEKLGAMRILLVDNVNLLPGGNAPELKFDLHQIHYDNADGENPIDDVSTITMEFTGQLNLTTGSTIEACLDNANDGTMYLP